MTFPDISTSPPSLPLRAQLLLGTALALTTATRFRLPGLPVGAGELLLLALMASSLLPGALSLKPQPTLKLPRVRRCAAMWGILLAGLLAGAAMGHATGHFDPVFGLREFAALGFCAAYCFWLCSWTWNSDDMQRVLITCATVIVTVNAPLLAHVLYMEVFHNTQAFLIDAVQNFLMGAKPTYGWALNINQLMLPVIISIPLLAGIIMDTHASQPRLLTAPRIALAAFLVFGLANCSRAFILCLLLGLFFAIAYHIWPRRWRRDTSATIFLSCIGIFISAYVASSVWAGSNITDKPTFSRPALLLHGVAALTDSHGLGFGPGPHSGLAGPHQGHEAHNTFLDVALSGGLLSGGAFAAMLASSCASVLALRQKRWMASWAMMLAFIMLHNMIRHPLFWTAALAPLLINPDAATAKHRTSYA